MSCLSSPRALVRGTRGNARASARLTRACRSTTRSKTRDAFVSIVASADEPPESSSSRDARLESARVPRRAALTYPALALGAAMVASVPGGARADETAARDGIGAMLPRSTSPRALRGLDWPSHHKRWREVGDDEFSRRNRNESVVGPYSCGYLVRTRSNHRFHMNTPLAQILGDGVAHTIALSVRVTSRRATRRITRWCACREARRRYLCSCRTTRCGAMRRAPALDPREGGAVPASTPGREISWSRRCCCVWRAR